MWSPGVVAARHSSLLFLATCLPSLQFRAGLLQQLSDLQLHQNDEKTATLRALLQSESLLDAAGGGMGGDEGLASSSDSEDEFVVFSAADLEAADEAHGPEGRASEAPWYRQRPCITALVGYGESVLSLSSGGLVDEHMPWRFWPPHGFCPLPCCQASLPSCST